MEDTQRIQDNPQEGLATAAREPVNNRRLSNMGCPSGWNLIGSDPEIPMEPHSHGSLNPSPLTPKVNQLQHLAFLRTLQISSSLPVKRFHSKCFKFVLLRMIPTEFLTRTPTRERINIFCLMILSRAGFRA